ncbi:DUF1905 domain-containing protein [Hymenobacter koreensis]|uniref:YdeI/OmpD-associated family protein n=1 Tax=Hymenobacter koreensis TaxID=1084523 RepID=A0ABP8IUY1_9BACT
MTADVPKTPLVDCEVTLEKFAGKGGWTFAPLPPLPPQRGQHFGVLKVTGQLDNVQLPPMHVMPMGQGRRFLPVNAALRRQLGKQAGDTVHVRLFTDAEPPSITEADWLDCLADAPAACRAYQALPTAQQQAWLLWVSAPFTPDAQVTHVETALAQLAAGAGWPPSSSPATSRTE